MIDGGSRNRGVWSGFPFDSCQLFDSVAWFGVASASHMQNRHWFTSFFVVVDYFFET